MTKKIFSNAFNIFLLLSVICSLILVPTSINKVIKIVLLVSIIVSFMLYYLFMWFQFKKVYKFFYLLFVLVSIITIVYIFLDYFGILQTFSSVHELKEFILSTKEKGVIIYILIQCSQVIFMPIPAAVICIVGSLIYGPLLSGIYCSIGVLIGSYISFLLGKTFGYRIVSWIVGKDNTEKYSEIIRRRGPVFLVLAFLLPMFPDDILCLIAGITKMKFSTFFWITLITRPIGVLCMSYFSSGELIPFSGWGIYVWGIISVFAIILSVFIYKYQEKMQNYIMTKIFKK